MTQPTHTSPELILLVGMPGCGKSTWRQKFFADNTRKPEDWTIISRDDAVGEYIEQNLKADGTHLRYDEVMADEKIARRLANEQEGKLSRALVDGKNVIVDRTNLVRNGRDVIMNQARTAGHNYSISAVVFDVPFDTILERAEGRGAGKHIPVEVLRRMHDAFNPIGADEGFGAITTITQEPGVVFPSAETARANAAVRVAAAPTGESGTEPK